jgi:hypothetical protein
MKILKTYLASKFDIKDLGNIKCFLGIGVISPDKDNSCHNKNIF